MRLLLLTLALAATAASQTAPLEGAPADRDRFVGEWIGEYACEETGRRGTIVFRLPPGADSVDASVLMMPRPTPEVRFPAPIPLAVHRVEVRGRSVRGVLARYEDPEWGLPLETTFGGTLAHDDHLEGYFRAVGTRIDTVPQNGRWWATRVASLPSAPPGRPVH